MKRSSIMKTIQKRRRIIIAAAALALLGGLAYATLPARWHYRLFHDEASLSEVLSQVEPGAPVSDLERLLGPIRRETGDARRELLATYRGGTKIDPGHFPEGVTDDDQFLSVPMGEMILHLQVRGERLVNFDPQDFGETSQPVAMLHTIN